MRYVLHLSIIKKNWHIWNIFRTSFEEFTAGLSVVRPSDLISSFEEFTAGLS